jgi:hypothetical protein
MKSPNIESPPSDTGPVAPPEEIKLILGESIADYVTNAYNTLISVVQGVAIAALCVEFDKANPSTPHFFYAKAILVFLVICLIWHRYIVENQFIAWRLAIPDTIIPMAFAVLQIRMVNSLSEGPGELCIAFLLLFICGGFAYWNGRTKHSTPQAKEMFTRHFVTFGDGIGHRFLQVFLSFQRVSFWAMAAFAIIAGVVWATLKHNGHLGQDDKIGNVAVLAVGYLATVLTFRCDLQYFIKRDPKLKPLLAGLRCKPAPRRRRPKL